MLKDEVHQIWEQNARNYDERTKKELSDANNKNFSWKKVRGKKKIK